MGYDPEYYQRRYAKWKAEGLCRNCGREPEPGRTKCAKCLETAARSSRSRTRRHRERVFAHYGTECVCCGESEPLFLTIDHINGGGRAHHREIKGTPGAGTFYNWLISQEFPEGFQVLCFNCNSGRHRNGGTCPHEGR
jgi:hypothetical protein